MARIECILFTTDEQALLVSSFLLYIFSLLWKPFFPVMGHGTEICSLIHGLNNIGSFVQEQNGDFALTFSPVQALCLFYGALLRCVEPPKILPGTK